MKKILKFNEYIKESDSGGVAVATLGNTGGMGNIVAPQPSSTPGDVAGSSIGSGDIVSSLGTFSKNTTTSKKKKKKKKKPNGDNYQDMYVTKISDWLNNEKNNYKKIK